MKNPELFNMVGHLVSMHRDKKMDDFDLYNSILGLIYSGTEEDRAELKRVVEWIDSQEDNPDRKAQYSYKNITENAGEAYREGIMRIQAIPEK